MSFLIYVEAVIILELTGAAVRFKEYLPVVVDLELRHNPYAVLICSIFSYFLWF